MPIGKSSFASFYVQQRNGFSVFSMQITIFVALFSMVFAAPSVDMEAISVVSTNNEINVNGNDVYDSDEMVGGTEAYGNEKAKQIGTKPEDIGIYSKGSYSYNFPETIITVNWFTDEKTNAVHTYIQVSYPVLKTACRSMACKIDYK